MSQAKVERRTPMPETPESVTPLGVAIPPGATALLQYLQVELVDKYLKPLESRLLLLEQRFDYWSTQAISEITKSSITAAYNVVSQKMDEQFSKIIDERFSRLFSTVQTQVSELDEHIKRVEAVREAFSTLNEKVEKLGAGLKVDASSIVKELREGLETQVKGLMEKVDQTYASKLDEFTKEFSRQIGELGSKIEELGGELQNLTTILSSILKHIKKMEAGVGVGGEEAIGGAGELGGEAEDFESEGEVETL